MAGTMTAGAEALIRDEGEISPAWLTDVLRSSGALPTGSSVTAASVERFGEGVGLLSFLFRVTPTYQGPAPDAPTSLVVKLPTDDVLQRGIADALAFYQREVGFYRELASQVPFRSPRCHAAVQAVDSSDFVLVLEDVGHCQAIDQVTGCTWPEVVRAVDALASFHARWWADPRLSELETTFLPLRNPIHEAVLPAVFDAGWEPCKVAAADALSPEVVAFGDRWGELCTFFLDELSSPTTLLHGDWRSDNLFVDGDELVVIDFQIMGTGNGAFDLGYFASQSVEPTVRAGRDRELVERYVDGLHTGGVDVEVDDVWRQYRLALAFCFIYGVTSFQTWENLNPRGQQLLMSMLRRSATAIVDTGATSILPG